MATLSGTAHVSTNPFQLLSCPSLTARKARRSVKKLAAAASEVRIATIELAGKKEICLYLLCLAVSNLLLVPNHAVAGSGFDKYVKRLKRSFYPMEVALIMPQYDKLRKKLNPLEAYVSPVILTQLQIKDFEKSLEGDQPQFATCRSLLRSGPAASLRVNIRAVVRYASDDDGNGKTASSDVDQCLRALEELDSLLLHATSNERAPVSSMKAQINTALNALDSGASKGKIAADSYRNSLENADLDISDPDLKQLESIL